jgi:sulfite exporter TauE/SafE
MSDAISLWAALLAGVAASGHCFAMCGGMAGALGLRARNQSRDNTSLLMHTSLYHCGRIGGYAIAGALCGLFGSTVNALLDLARLGAALRIASGVLMLLIAARIVIRWNGLAWLERQGAKFWTRIQPLATRQLSGTHSLNAVAVGFLWGWLPCGLVYSMLLFATTSANGLQGASIMIAFGIGTLPSMLTSSLFAAKLQALLKHNIARLLSGIALACFGLWMIVAAIQHSGHDASNASPNEHADHSQHIH